MERPSQRGPATGSSAEASGEGGNPDSWPGSVNTTEGVLCDTTPREMSEASVQIKAMQELQQATGNRVRHFFHYEVGTVK